MDSPYDKFARKFRGCFMEAMDDEIISAFVFYPRKQWGPPLDMERVRDLLFELANGVAVGGRLFLCEKTSPTILYFHGNGEIASDYDEIAPLYVERGLNLLVVDYRGYGRSSGKPTISSLLEDAENLLEPLSRWLQDNHLDGSLWVMGRSLGSLPAIHLAASRGEIFEGLVVESGFAYTLGLLQRVGAPIGTRPIPEPWPRINLLNISKVKIPTLIIHGELDEIIPIEDARALWHACGSEKKELLVIPGAGHNDLLWIGQRDYMDAIIKLVRGGISGR